MNEKIDAIINKIVHSIYSIKGIKKGQILFYALYEEDSMAFGLFYRASIKEKIMYFDADDTIIDNCFELNSIMSKENMQWNLFILKIENMKFNVEFKYPNKKAETLNETTLREELLEGYFGVSTVVYPQL